MRNGICAPSVQRIIVSSPPVKAAEPLVLPGGLAVWPAEGHLNLTLVYGSRA